MYVSPYITEGLKGELADVSSVNDVTLSLNSFIARPQICTVGQFVIVGSFFNSNEGDYNTARRQTVLSTCPASLQAQPSPPARDAE